MKLLLDINDSEASFVMELLKKFSFIKTTPISVENEFIVENSIPEWQKELVRERIKNTKPEDYLTLEEVEKKITFD